MAGKSRLKQWQLMKGRYVTDVLLKGSNVESVEVTEEAVKGMSGPTFYYAEVSCNLTHLLSQIFDMTHISFLKYCIFQELNELFKILYFSGAK